MEETDYSEIEGLNIQSRLVKLKELNEILIQIFCVGSVQESNYRLSELEERLLSAFLQRKFFKKIRLSEMGSMVTQKIAAINSSLLSNSSKRPEEFYKFVLTRIIKHLRNRFKATSKKGKFNEEDFYLYYFGETSKAMGVPLKQYYYPLTGQNGKKDDDEKGPTNLNSDYYERIFCSDLFVSDMEQCLEMLRGEYHREIIKKLESLLIRWDSEFQAPTCIPDKLSSTICEYLEQNKRCKLPWTLREVDFAVMRFRVHVANIRKRD